MHQPRRYHAQRLDNARMGRYIRNDKEGHKGIMTEQSRRGRRPKDQKRVPLSMRVTPAVREQLVSIAAESGRSITQEAEIRLERSLRTEYLLIQCLDIAFGQENTHLLYTLGNAIVSATYSARGSAGVDRWHDDASVFESVKNVVSEIFEKLRPPGTANDQVTKQIEHIIKNDTIRAMATDNGRQLLERLRQDPTAILFTFEGAEK
jgi:hypothetical protein